MLALQMPTIRGAIISALSLSSLQLMPSSPVALVADIFCNGLRTNSVVIFGNLNDTFSGFFCLIYVLSLE